MAKKDNASFEGEKQRTPVRIKELADAVAGLAEALKKYLPLTGGKLTGRLVVWPDVNWSQIQFGDSSGVSNHKIHGYTDAGGTVSIVQLEANRDGTDDNRTVFSVYSKHDGTVPTNAVRFSNYVNGTPTVYNLYGEHNRSLLNSYFLPLSGGTVTGTTVFSKTTDASGTADNLPALIVGGAVTAQHLELDGNEIQSKSNGTTPAALGLNQDGGDVIIGNKNSQVTVGQRLRMIQSEGIAAVVMSLYPDSDPVGNYGNILVIGAAGDTYIGAGESANNLYNAIGATASENMYVCADNNLYLYAACNTIANRKGLCLSSRAFNPVTDAGFILGSASYRWGQIYSSASSISTSDRNEKHDIRDLDPEPAKRLILGLRPVSYKFNNGTSGRTHSGMIAQDVEELLSELGISTEDCAAFIKSPLEELDIKTGQYDPVTDEDGNLKYRYGLRYEEFIAPLIKTVQEQQKMISRLEERIAKLEERLGGDADVADAEN